MAKILTILLIALVFEALGVVSLKQGIGQITSREKEVQGGDIKINLQSALRLLRGGISNGCVLLGVAFEALFFAGLLVLMAHRDISFVWPLTSLSFVMTTIASILILKERVGGVRWAGVALIMLGAACIIWSEKLKETRAAETTVAQTKPPH